MALTATTRVRDLGPVVELGTNAVFSVDDSEKVWIVHAGTLDLFFADVRQDGSTGNRHHFLRVREGGAVFGFGGNSGSGTRLFAHPGPATKILCLQRFWPDVPGDIANPHPLLPLLEQWIADLSVAATDKIAPKSFVRLEPGHSLAFGENDGAALSLETLVWIKPLAGTVRFLGSADVPALDSQHFFPVARGMWVACSAHTTLECVDSQTILSNDSNWQGLEAFANLVVAYMRWQILKREEQERQRILGVAEADAVSFADALHGLAKPLQEAEEAEADAVAAADPLLRACQIVGRIAGIEIKPASSTLRKLRQRDPVNAIARAAGVQVRMVLLRGKWWRKDNGPLLGFLAADNQPVALLPQGATHYRLFNPATQHSSPVSEAVARHLKEVAYVFYRPFPARAMGLRDVVSFALRGCRADLSRIVLLGITSGIMATLTPIFTGFIFDDIIPGAQRHALTQLTLFLVVSAFASTIFTLTRNFAVLRLEAKIDSSVQAAVWDRTLALPVSFFRNYTAGDLALRSLALGQIRQILTATTLSTILSGIFSIFSFALLFYYSWRLALIATTLTGVAALLSLLCGYFQIGYQRELSQRQGKISGMILEFIQGMPKFRVSGTESRVFAAWAREFTKQKVTYFRARKLSNALAVFDSVFPVIAYGSIFYCAAALLSGGSRPVMTTGEFLAFFVAFTQFLSAALSLSQSAVSTLTIVPLIERAKPILDAQPEVDGGKTDPGELSGHIEGSHLFFRYRQDTPLVIKNVSFNLQAGQFIAFVGASGSGKSTLFRLLLGFEKPESGGIYFDGQDLSGLDVHAVRRQFGVVLQNGRVLSGDIFTNIVGAAPLTFDDAWEAARLSGFDRDIEEMPMGMHTIVSEGGGGLSGGQRQRLMVARAIVGRPRILLFDEATSALDNHTQAIVSRSLENLHATRIVIAHRLSTVMNADRIFVMDKGHIVETGNYDELMKANGVFAELAKRQLT